MPNLFLKSGWTNHHDAATCDRHQRHNQRADELDDTYYAATIAGDTVAAADISKKSDWHRARAFNTSVEKLWQAP
jgi:hypothetical protein